MSCPLATLASGQYVRSSGYGSQPSTAASISGVSSRVPGRQNTSASVKISMLPNFVWSGRVPSKRAPLRVSTASW